MNRQSARKNQIMEKPKTRREKVAEKAGIPERAIIGRIYRAMSPSGKSYVGQTINSVETRWTQHIQDSKLHVAGTDRCKALNSAIIKYTPEKFILTVLWEGESGPENVILDEMERKFVTEYNSLAPNGYNLREGGNGRLTEAAIENMVKGNIVKTLNKAMYGGLQLPRYVLYHTEVNKNGTTLEGFRVCDHPHNKSTKSFLKKTMTMDAKLQAAIAYIAELDALPGPIKPKCPKYIQKAGKGFKVQHEDKTTFTLFTGEETEEENFEDALTCHREKYPELYAQWRAARGETLDGVDIAALPEADRPAVVPAARRKRVAPSKLVAAPVLPQPNPLPNQN
jgi:GIY-YIG catalytic domain